MLVDIPHLVLGGHLTRVMTLIHRIVWDFGRFLLRALRLVPEDQS